ncbi:MAG: hypothetical protein B6I22_03820 [Desulfobacteraceae bacterium 4572_123]|nr:MAG: hypothetical protein B6I22_03820 [Desulfobacteraceae bacterium 4572_123]
MIRLAFKLSGIGRIRKYSEPLPSPLIIYFLYFEKKPCFAVKTDYYSSNQVRPVHGRADFILQERPILQSGGFEYEILKNTNERRLLQWKQEL